MSKMNQAAQLRQQHLQFWAWAGEGRSTENGVARIPLNIELYEGYNGTAQYDAIDSTLRNLAVTSLETRGGTYKRAQLRASDIVKIEFDVAL